MSNRPEDDAPIDLSVPEPEHTLESALARIERLRREIAVNTERGTRLATFFLNDRLSRSAPADVLVETSEMLRDYIAEAGFAEPDGEFWIALTRAGYGLDVGPIHGRPDELAIERATASVDEQFSAPVVEGAGGRCFLAVPFALFGDEIVVYGWLGVELLADANPDETTVSIMLAIAMWMRQQLERASAMVEAKLSTEIARIAAQAQESLARPLELDDALRHVAEMMHASADITGAAAVRFDHDTRTAIACWGGLDENTTLKLAADPRLAPQNTVVLPVVVDGVEEAVLVLQGASGAVSESAEILATVAGAIGGTVARHRAAETIELLRRSAMRQLIEAQERERSMIAADVHDGVLQQLGATAIRLELAQAQVERGDFDTAREIIGDGAKEIRSCARELRALLMELRPQVLDDNGLAAALKELGHHLEQVEVEVATNVPDDLGNEYSITIFRIVQEALNNIAKHAQASHARVDVHVDDGSVAIEITDDGIGFEAATTGPSAEGSHLGLLGMRERADMLGGTFSIEGHSGSGTRLVAVLPLKEDEHADSATAE